MFKGARFNIVHLLVPALGQIVGADVPAAICISCPVPCQKLLPCWVFPASVHQPATWLQQECLVKSGGIKSELSAIRGNVENYI